MKSIVSVSSSALSGWRFALLPLVVGLFAIASISPARAQEEHMARTLTVSGQGSENVATTLTQVQLGVEVQGDTADKTQQEAARRSAAVVNFLRGRSVEKLQTTGINLSPRYDYNNGRQRIIGYTATNTVSFRVPTDRAGALMDEAVQAGATRIDGISFIADDATLATARQQAIREAIADAQAQADAALNALGLKRKEIVSVQVNGATPPPRPVMYREAAMSRADAAPTPVVGGEQEVQASVTLQVGY